MPALDSLPRTASDALALYQRATERDDFDGRATALWGLVAARTGASDWVEQLLHSGDLMRIEDAAGVLQWTGAPPAVAAQLEELFASLPDGSARDAVLAAMPSPVRDRLGSEMDRSEGSHDGGAVLFGGAMDPFTERIWYVEADLDRVLVELFSWYDDRGDRFSIDQVEGGVAGLLTRLEPWTMPSPSYLLVETTGPWTACFSQGSDIYVAYVLGERLGVRSIGSAYAPHVKRDCAVRRYGITEFVVQEPGGTERALHLSRQDSGWVFDVIGDPLEFEEQELYTSRYKRDRFPLSTMNRYLGHLGVDRANPAFYGPRGVVVTDHWSGGATGRSMSSADWRRAHS